eukprot:gnl/TRDRNA2_/TRDRNA2_174769_c2_seq38.p1 gnl/TRDRNA2_/TRDRNA2_174769_c2~~gnl/TRDRNA2_/TRDRNA2_174769_c2_seq38.p1  ORF type:complete len:117 (-),score=5.69 gnl/TRDRNA2_/TRDRNA2_174769_c2_seq38:66-416(-)
MATGSIAVKCSVCARFGSGMSSRSQDGLEAADGSKQLVHGSVISTRLCCIFLLLPRREMLQSVNCFVLLLHVSKLEHEEVNTIFQSHGGWGKQTLVTVSGLPVDPDVPAEITRSKK